MEKLKIHEVFTRSKTGNATDNEDGYFISDHYLAVIDGASSKTDQRYRGMTGGQVVRDILLKALEGLEGRETFEETILFLQKRIEEDFPLASNFPAAASIVIYSIYHQEIWIVGDCQALVDGISYYPKKKVDEVISQARALAIAALLEGGMAEEELRSQDLGRELILPFLRLQSNFENKRGSYGYLVLNNDQMDLSVLREKGVVISVPSGAHVVLASDGYPRLFDTLAASEEALVKLLQNDPLCYHTNVSTKGLKKNAFSFDDRTFLSFSLEGFMRR